MVTTFYKTRKNAKNESLIQYHSAFEVVIISIVYFI